MIKFRKTQARDEQRSCGRFIFKARSPTQTLNALDEYLRSVGDEPVRWLAREVRSWGNEFSYSELAAAIEAGNLDDLINWQERYAEIVNGHLAPLWAAAIAEASKKATRGMTVLSDSNDYVRGWINTHGGELITRLSDESRLAVMNVILRGQGLRMAPRDVAKEVRPLIGLNDRQAAANQKYKQEILQRYLERGMSESKAAERAEKAALKYAAKQHRYRAETIVLTENAYAYNRGAHMSVCQSIADGYMGRCAMIWTTAGTNRVCSRCLALKDTVVGYTDELGVLLPPLHPRCRCAIMYDEVGTPRAMKPKPKPQPQPVPKPRATSGESAQGLANLLVPNPNPLPLKSIGIRHYATIQVILANAPNPKAAAVWSKFEDKIRIGDTSRKGTAVHFNGAIYFSIDEIKNGNIINEPYQIFFHEGSHNIDYALAKNGQNFSEYYGNEGLLNALEKDLAGLVPNIVELKSKWIQKYTLRERAILSGLLDLYSNGKHNLGTGHNREYWLQGGRARKSREVFAMFMEASIANATAYEILNRYLPTAVKTFDAMLEELLK